MSEVHTGNKIRIRILLFLVLSAAFVFYLTLHRFSIISWDDYPTAFIYPSALQSILRPGLNSTIYISKVNTTKEKNSTHQLNINTEKSINNLSFNKTSHFLNTTRNPPEFTETPINITLNYHYQNVYRNAIKRERYEENSRKKKPSRCKNIHWKLKEDLYFEDLIYKGAGVPEDLREERPQDYENSNVTLKKILFWNDAYTQKHFGFGYGREPFIRANCAEDRCFTTSDRDQFSASELDAVMWHLRASDSSLPKDRSPTTRYIMWMVESSSHTYTNLSYFNDIFNWTFTYKLNSDFPTPYGLVLPRKKCSKRYSKRRKFTKTKMAAWFVSNCRTEALRETLVQTLQNYIEVDVYGSCGYFKCARKNQKECYQMLEKDYKFYFSFENSLCIDYVTEKFFNILKYNVIPVVYGLGNYVEVAPPHSYINALEFPSVKALADYLIYLDKNDTAYYEYFSWKKNYGLIKGWTSQAVPWCALCKRLHEDKEIQIYKNMKKWFEDESRCRNKYNDNTLPKFVHGYDGGL